MKRIYIVILLSIVSFGNVFAQDEEEKTLEQIISKGFRINMSDDGKVFAKFGFGTQIWTRFMDLNPGATDPNGMPITKEYDIMLRRNYLSVYSSLDRVTLFAMLAMGSQNAHVSTNPFNPYHKTPSFFFYDAFGSYKIHKKHLIMGMGLNMYNGISRYSSGGSSTTIGVDVPVIAVPDLLTTYQNARQMSVFATGKFGKFDYRIALAKPYVASNIPTSDTASYIAYEYPNHGLSFKGYFTVQLWDQESCAMPFYTSSYLGAKKVLNFGVGFDYNPESTISFDDDGESTMHDRLHIGADVFLDLPFENNSVVTFYASYFLFDYGPNYLISYGIQDICNGGITEPQHGTGSAIHSQLAYVLPEDWIKTKGKFQVYSLMNYRDFDALNEVAINYSLGMNYYIAGHKIKWTLEYQNRPVFDASNNLETRKGLAVGKFQIQI
jgi:hypothetical protein